MQWSSTGGRILTLHGQSRRMSEPSTMAIRVHLFEDVCDVGHRAIGGDPAFFQIGEVDLAVLAFFITEVSNRAPEGFDVAKHLAAEGPDAGHPIAIEAPDQVVANQAGKLLAGDVYPLGGIVFWEADQSHEG